MLQLPSSRKRDRLSLPRRLSQRLGVQIRTGVRWSLVSRRQSYSTWGGRFFPVHDDLRRLVVVFMAFARYSI